MGERVKETVRRLLGQGAVARSHGYLDQAYGAFEQAVAISRDAGLDEELVDSLKSCAQIERDRGRSAGAIPLYEEAVSIGRKLGHSRTLSHTIRHLGDVQFEEGVLSDAEACYVEALALYRAAIDTPKLELANAVRPLALLRQRTGQAEEAKRLWVEARDLYVAVGVAEGVHEAELHLDEVGT